ncbi:hypothetical protein VTK73DRAFT_1144 [Phialemonium thermophilum]|uniref:BTB domain-containing protein n=1 Tax=Phialemonium thermophilum TaxID=223376 RepID=A0ABR3XAV4_9PEZI
MVYHGDTTSGSLVAPRGSASVVGFGGSGSNSSQYHQQSSHHHGSYASHERYHHARTSSSQLSSSRARRYNRSHAGGGASFAPQNEFPVFSNSGDVEIVIRVASGHENRYLLHRHTLTRCSGFFEASTSSEWSRARPLPESGSAALSPLSSSLSPPPSRQLTLEESGRERGESADGRGGDDTQLARVEDGGSDRTNGERPSPLDLNTSRRRWRYELDPGTGDGDIPMLVQKDESSSNGGSNDNDGNAEYMTAPGMSNRSIFGGSAKPKSSSGAPYSSHAFFRSVANLGTMSSHHDTSSRLPPPTQAEQDLLRDYDNLFRIMYNYPPILDGVNIADAYVQCKSLLMLADQYDALGVVGPRVDHHLLQFQGQLWKQIAKYPISYLRLGYLARSKVIFQESLIHVVGQWPAGERSLRAALPDAVLDLIEDKVDELEETVARVEARLFRLSLTTRSGEPVSPANAYLDWLAVSLFRQWLADNTAPLPSTVAAPGPVLPIPDRRSGSRDGAMAGHRTSRAIPGPPLSASGRTAGVHGRASTTGAGAPSSMALVPGATAPLATLGKTYRLLGSSAPGCSGYLGHEECKRFLKLTPDLYTRDNLRRFEKRVEELKAMAREVVRPLMGSRLELFESSGGGRAGGLADGIGYFTCTTIGDRDLPWDYE